MHCYNNFCPLLLTLLLQVLHPKSLRLIISQHAFRDEAPWKPTGLQWKQTLPSDLHPPHLQRTHGTCKDLADARVSALQDPGHVDHAAWSSPDGSGSRSARFSQSLDSMLTWMSFLLWKPDPGPPSSIALSTCLPRKIMLVSCSQDYFRRVDRLQARPTAITTDCSSNGAHEQECWGNDCLNSKANPPRAGLGHPGRSGRAEDQTKFCCCFMFALSLWHNWACQTVCSGSRLDQPKSFRNDCFVCKFCV